jgi:hypothetical protein
MKIEEVWELAGEIGNAWTSDDAASFLAPYEAENDER